MRVGVEVCRALIMSSDGLWKHRLGEETGDGAYQLCHHLHQLCPDPFSPERFAQTHYGL